MLNYDRWLLFGMVIAALFTDSLDPGKMKSIKIIVFELLLIVFASQMHAQDNPVVLQRTPEQEAAKQTEKLQQELNLNQEQARRIYEINLRYARARQVSNTRVEAMERMKNKNADIEKVLSEEQNERLQSKRYERTNYDPNTGRMTQSVPQATLRQQGEYRQGATMRANNGGQYTNTYRQGAPPVPVVPPSATYRNQSPQTVRRSEPSTSGNSGGGYSAPSAVRSQPQAAPAYRSSGAPANNSAGGSGRGGNTSAGSRR